MGFNLMDGIGLELWNKKLLECRYKRQRDYRALAELSMTSRAFATEPLPTALFQAAADNLELMVLYWKETFLGSWQRQKPENPEEASGQAQGEILTLLSTEQKQIEHEIPSFAAGRGLKWKPEELAEGKAHLEKIVSILRLAGRAHVADLKSAREDELTRDKTWKKTHWREIWESRTLLTSFILVGSLAGIWIGATLNAHRSTADRQYIDERMKTLAEGQHRMQEELSELHRSNRKIAFWTEKTPQQIDKEMDDARDSLKAQIQDIREETLRKIARLESEYARSGRDGGTELDMRKQSLIRQQAKLIEEAESKTDRKLTALEEQKHNIMR
jgi:hypothetical protein